jgi:two-component system phosphate regulon sensor histidine kinase PhoR
MTDHELLGALFGHVGDDALVIVDDRLRVSRASTEAAELAQRPVEQLPGMSLIAAFGSAALDDVAKSALSGEPVARTDDALVRIGRREFEVTAVQAGSAGLALWLHDVTAARRAGQARRDFVANISHELRTPLASIKLLAETLADGAVADEQTGHEFAVQIQREVDHLAQLVDELLDLSMIESGETVLAIGPADPSEIVEDVAERIGPIAARREIAVRAVEPMSVESRAMRAAADPSHLSRALLNLAHNAVKFSDPGSEVRVGWDPQDGVVRFWVADDGVGIPFVHRERIFERFYKVDRARARGGTDDGREDVGGVSAGLGLAIVRHIAEAHDGAVGFDSEEGAGSTFWIDVPIATAEPYSEPAAS